LRSLRLDKSLTAKGAKVSPRTLRKDLIFQSLFQPLIRISNYEITALGVLFVFARDSVSRLRSKEHQGKPKLLPCAIHFHSNSIFNLQLRITKLFASTIFKFPHELFTANKYFQRALFVVGKMQKARFDGINIILENCKL
jgi:hypothetical protein